MTYRGTVTGNVIELDEPVSLADGHPVILAHLRGLPDDATTFMSVVSQAELLAGIEEGRLIRE